MACKDAMVTDPMTVSPETKVGVALEMLEEKGIRSTPVVDAEGVYLGMFSFHQILKSLLPVSATMEGGLDDLPFLDDATGDLQNKLDEIREHPVSELMSTDIRTVNPDTVFIEGLFLMYKNGLSPLPVVDAQSGKLLGMVSKQSAISTLQRHFPWE